MISSRMKIYFVSMLLGSIAIALIGYFYTAQDLPPYPEKVVSLSGTVLSGKDQIMAGQQVWQKYGLMDLGSVWGHGTYRGPDFTAQALHNMSVNMREALSQSLYADSYAESDTLSQGAVGAVVIDQIKTNRYDAASDTLTLTSLQESALLANRKFYDKLFLEGESRGPIRAKTVKDSVDRQNLADFFFWTAWVSGTVRPGDTHTYTNNWPIDPDVGNFVSGKSLVWSGISLVAFGVCLGLMIFLYHKYEFNRGSPGHQRDAGKGLVLAGTPGMGVP